MGRLLICIIFAAVASSAGASGWRDLRIDATTQSAFEKSVADFQRLLPSDRRLYFEVSLQEIWHAVAEGLGPEATMDKATAAYFKRLDGLRYEQVIRVGGQEARKTYVALVPRAMVSLPQGMPASFSGGFTEQSATGNWSAGVQQVLDRNGGR